MLLDGSVLPTFAWEEQGAEAAALTLSQFRFMAAFFLSLPVAWLFRFVPTVRGRHLYALLTGFALIYYPFGNGCFHAFISSGATYLIMWRFRDHAATLAWLVDFMYLIGCHVSSASGQAWKQGQMDFTGAQMVLTLKIISAAACYQDGAKPAAELRPYQESMKLHLMPSLLEFFSYVFAAGNLLAGPFFEFRDYIEYVERKGAWAVAQGKRLPSGGASGLVHLGKALICMVIHLRLVPHFPVELLESRWHRQQPFLERLLLLYIVPTVYRFKYYFAWCIAETSLILSGLNFNGYTDSGKARWDRYINTRIRKVEFCPSAAQLPQHWNICTGLFLRQYVYERLTVKGKKPTFVTLIITQIVSGIWHGLFAGYALFFVNVAFAIQASKVLFRYERNWPSWLTNALPWTALKCVLTALLLNYSAGANLILDFFPSIAIWRSVGFVGHWIILAILLVGIAYPPRKPAGARSQKPSGKATGMDATSPADGKANPASGTPSVPPVVDINKSA